MTKPLPKFIHELLAATPRAGEGVHHWLFRVARQLHAHLPAGEIVHLLENQVAHCGRPVPRQEIVAAVQNALPVAWQPSGHAPAVQPASKWPAVNQARREAVIREGGSLADLWELSPIRIEDNVSKTEEIIDQLFAGNLLLCCGRSQSEFDTRPREDWRGQLAQLQFIVPSPMTAIEGITKDGKPSKHTLANTAPRRFLVCEFDQGTIDEQAALLLHLATFAPLVCALHSGGKSLHAWFFVASQPEQKVLKFFKYAVAIGADPATWGRSQFVRMPDGRRANGKRQTVYFLNFKPLEAKQ